MLAGGDSVNQVEPMNISQTLQLPTDTTGFKRKKNPASWERNVKKKLRNSGKAYETATKTCDAREVKAACTNKCKLKCAENISRTQREDIFKLFWEIADIDQQRSFVAQSMTLTTKKSSVVGGSNRQANNTFCFTVNNDEVRVCKVFFKNTLDITDRMIRTVVNKRNVVANVLVAPDLRGKHNKHVSLDPQIRKGILDHINSIPRVESHNLRSQTKREYIDGSRTISEIHRDYVEECNNKGESSVKYPMFYRVFKDDFNISFFKPKKDLCETCVAYENSTPEEKVSLQESYDKHIQQKKLSREEKQRDKADNSSEVTVFDLQAVMQLPKGNHGLFYYVSKLNVLNLTFYNLKTNVCNCYVWDEANGNRGPNEIGSCLLDYMTKIADEKPNIDLIFWTDNCSGQNKNQFIVALYIFATQNLNIKSITHKFLVKGHTQNEGDCAHSLIERNVSRILKGGSIYTTEGFISAIKGAKKNGPPFKVHEQSYEDFFNIKNLAKQLELNCASLKISDVRVLKLEKAKPGIALIKNDFGGEFVEVNVLRRNKKTGTLSDKIQLEPVFETKPGLNEKTKLGLMKLFDKKAIPNAYREFYQHL